MGPEALKTLSGSGTLGAVMAPILGLLGVVIGVLIWMLKGMFTRWLEADKVKVRADEARESKYNEFMAAFTSSLNAMTLNLQATRSDSLAAIRDTQSNLLAGIQGVIRLSHDEAKIERKELIEQAVEKLSGEITGAANSIRNSNEKLAATFEKQIDAAERQRLLEEKRRLQEENDDLSKPHTIDDAAPRRVR
jgi:hypothetical protein